MVISTLYRSYLAAGISITLFMIILFASFKLGMISMLPNFLPIIYGLGFMSFLDISLNMTTLMVGSISLGLVVDDTIHFLQNFEDYFKKKKNPKEAVEKTLLGVGRSLTFTTIILVSGFISSISADMTDLINFGLVTSFTISVALLVDLIVLPSLLVLFYRK